MSVQQSKRLRDNAAARAKYRGRAMTARRVKIFNRAGKWHFKAQAANWRTIDASGAGADRRSTVEKIVRRRWPNAEVVIEE